MHILELAATFTQEGAASMSVELLAPAERLNMEVQVRWMIRRDMAEVLKIEQESFDSPWNEEDFLCRLRQLNCIGMVAEDRTGSVVGFMIYELLKSQLHVLNFAVAPWRRRSGIGHLMVEKLVNKLSQQRRQEITLETRESNIAAQLFFKRLRFEAVAVLRGHYEDTEEDAYQFVRAIDDQREYRPFEFSNRIRSYRLGTRELGE